MIAAAAALLALATGLYCTAGYVTRAAAVSCAFEEMLRIDPLSVAHIEDARAFIVKYARSRDLLIWCMIAWPLVAWTLWPVFKENKRARRHKIAGESEPPVPTQRTIDEWLAQNTEATKKDYP